MYLTRVAVIFLGAVFCFLPQVAQAADGAELNLIGYSADSHYFAFEQYGIEDGSGFPYSEIFVIDLVNNTWVKDSPFRERNEVDGVKLGEVRTAAMAKAAALLKSLKIDEPVQILAFKSATEVLGDRNRVQFDRNFLSSSMGSKPESNENVSEGRFELSVETSKANWPADCTVESGPYFGYTVKLRSLKTGTTSELYRDDSIPASRHCPVGYDIAAIAAPTGYPQVIRYMAIIGVYSLGFEGTDRRYVAVPFTID